MDGEILVARATGWVALSLLALALSMTPVARLSAFLGRGSRFVRRASTLRRLLGMASAFVATFHAISAVSGYLDGEVSTMASFSYLRAGLLALLILLALLVTSFPRLVRALRVRVWKPLHRLAYVAAALAMLHLLSSPFAPRAVTLGFFATLVLVGAMRLLPRRARAPRPAGPDAPR